jgi:hypothetical protein
MYRVLALAVTWSMLSFPVLADTQNQTKSFPASSGDTLVVLNDFGKVRIRGTDAAEVQAGIQMVSAGKFAPEFQVAAQKAGHEIYIYCFYSGQPQEAMNLEVQVPRFLNLVIWGANPEIDIQGIAGTVRIQSISGKITLQDSTSSTIAVSDRGDIVYRTNIQPQGDIRLESTSGNIQCQIANNLNLRGWLRAGGAVQWDKDPEVRGTSTEKQLGSFGPILNAVSLAGNVRVETGAPGPAARTMASKPLQTAPEIPKIVEAKQQPVQTETKLPNPAPPAPAASTTQPVQMPDGKAISIKVSVDSVLLNVSVRDRISNRSVMGLGKNDFAVYEDGVPQEIQQVQT